MVSVMKYQVSHISSNQTSKVLAVMGIVVALPFSMVGLIGMFFSGQTINNEFMLAVLLFLLIPIMYGVIAYLFNRFFCALYNAIAKRIGGIEVTLQVNELKNND